MDETKKDRALLSHESTVVVSEQYDCDTDEIKNVLDSADENSHRQYVNSEMKAFLKEYKCKIEHFSPWEKDLKCQQRFLFGRLKYNRYILCIVSEDEVIFCLQENASWTILGRIHRCQIEKDNACVATTQILLSSPFNDSQYQACLKSIVITEENSLRVIKDYSYMFSFNIETLDAVELSSRENEICRER